MKTGRVEPVTSTWCWNTGCATHRWAFGHIDIRTYRTSPNLLRSYRPPYPTAQDKSNRSGQGRSGPQKAQFYVMFCGADTSSPDVSTAVARAFEGRSTGLPADSWPWTDVRSKLW